MRIKRDDTEFRMSAQVQPFDDNARGAIHVDRRRSFTREQQWEPEAGVNWSCFGTVDVATARQYAEAILEACRIADEMNAVVEEQPTGAGRISDGFIQKRGSTH